MRSLHPATWWIVAICLGASASIMPHLTVSLAVIALCTVMVGAWSTRPRIFGFYLVTGVIIVAIRVAWRFLLPALTSDIFLWSSVRDGFDIGVQLAAIVICVGMANALADPKRLLAATPPALYEVATALVVAITVMPQLVDSASRVRRAQMLRRAPTSRTQRMRRFLVPVLEDALDRSFTLAAGMETRGYGRTGDASVLERRMTTSFMLASLLLLCLGIYGVADTSVSRAVTVVAIVGGCLLAWGGFVVGGRRVGRTRYRPDPWRIRDSGVTVLGVAVLAAIWLANRPGVGVW